MISTMLRGLKRERIKALISQSSSHLVGAEHTLRIMEQDPTTIFIVNTLGVNLLTTITIEDRIYEICNAQSIGASIQNMILRATKLGLGSLWICDTYFAYKELNCWINVDGELIAAIALGYVDECQSPRPRKKLENILEWRE